VISTYCPTDIVQQCSDVNFGSVVSVLAANIYQQNHDRNHKLCSQWLSWRYHVVSFTVVIMV